MKLLQEKQSRDKVEMETSSRYLESKLFSVQYPLRFLFLYLFLTGRMDEISTFYPIRFLRVKLFEDNNRYHFSFHSRKRDDQWQKRNMCAIKERGLNQLTNAHGEDISYKCENKQEAR